MDSITLYETEESCMLQ